MAALSLSLSTASQEAHSEFEDHLKKNSISYDRQGTEYTPKDVDVYLNEKIVSAWQAGVSVRYVDLDDRTGDAYTIPLTRANWAAFQDVASDEGVVLQAKIEEQARYMVRLENSMATDMGEIRTDMESIRSVQTHGLDVLRMSVDRNVARIADVESSVAIANSGVSNIQQELNIVRNTSERNSTQITAVAARRGVDVLMYDFNLENTDDFRRRSHYSGWADYPTNMSADDYPLAFIGNWLVYGYCNDQSVRPPLLFKHEGNDRWVIAFDRSTTDCYYLSMQVFYIADELAGSDKRYTSSRHTDGPSLSRR